MARRVLLTGDLGALTPEAAAQLAPLTELLSRLDSLNRALEKAWYPSGATKAAVAAAWAADPYSVPLSVGSPLSVLNEDPETLCGTPISRVAALRSHLEPLALGLKACAHGLGLSSQAGAFASARADALISNHYRKSESLWLDWMNGIAAEGDASSSARLVLVLGPVRLLRPPSLPSKALFAGLVGISLPKQSATLSAVFSGWRSLLGCLPGSVEGVVLARHPGLILSVANAVGLGGWGPHPHPLALNLPADPVLRASEDSVALILANVVDATYTHILSPLNCALAHPDLPDPSPAAFLVLVAAMQIAHTLGPAVVFDPAADNPTNPNEPAHHVVEAEMASCVDALEGFKISILALWLSRELLHDAPADTKPRAKSATPDAVTWSELVAVFVLDLVRRSREHLLMDHHEAPAPPGLAALIGWLFHMGVVSVVSGPAPASASLPPSPSAGASAGAAASAAEPATPLAVLPSRVLGAGPSRAFVNVDLDVLATRLDAGVGYVLSLLESHDGPSADAWIAHLEAVYADHAPEWETQLATQDAASSIAVCVSGSGPFDP